MECEGAGGWPPTLERGTGSTCSGARQHAFTHRPIDQSFAEVGSVGIVFGPGAMNCVDTSSLVCTMATSGGEAVGVPCSFPDDVQEGDVLFRSETGEPWGGVSISYREMKLHGESYSAIMWDYGIDDPLEMPFLLSEGDFYSEAVSTQTAEQDSGCEVATIGLFRVRHWTIPGGSPTSAWDKRSREDWALRSPSEVRSEGACKEQDAMRLDGQWLWHGDADWLVGECD